MFVKPTEKRWAVTTASSITTRSAIAMPKTATAANRVVICPECKKEIEVRSGFAHATLTRHMKEHRMSGPTEDKNKNSIIEIDN